MTIPLITREEILALSDMQSETVTVPEWKGASFVVRGLTGEERDAFEASCVQKRGRKTEVDTRNLRAKLVVRACHNADGTRVFTDEDAPALGRKSAAAINRLFEVAARLSGITDDDLEELAGNSVRGRPGDTPSGSPARSA